MMQELALFALFCLGIASTMGALFSAAEEAPKWVQYSFRVAAVFFLAPPVLAIYFLAILG